MNKILFFLFAFPLTGFTQSSITVEQSVQDQLFSQAVSEYFNALKQEGKSISDTLFFGLYEDHHDKKLTATIQGKGVFLLKDEMDGNRRLAYRPKLDYANIVEFSITKEKAEYLFVAFVVDKQGEKIDWLPLHHCSLKFIYDANLKSYRLSAQKFEFPYSNRHTNKK